MASKYYFLNILIGLLIIISTALGIGFAYFSYANKIIVFTLSCLLIIEIILFIKNLNAINRKIASFFLAVQNEDTSILLPQKSKNKSIREIYEALNKVVQVFQKMKIESEFREQLFMAMIEHSSTGFISIDPKGNFEIMNETARNLIGVYYTSNLNRIEKQHPKLNKLLAELKPGEVGSCQIQNETGNTIIQVSSSKLIFKNKVLNLLSLLDIKKEIESRELESWQKLIRIMNHEIMNSIAPITSVSTSLLPIFKQKDKVIEVNELTNEKICDTINGLEVIATMSNGLKSFVNSYQKLSQIPKPILKKVNTHKWLSNIPLICDDFLSFNLAVLEIENHSKQEFIWFDESLINQVIVNLIKNAAEAPIKNKKKLIKLSIEETFQNNALIKVSNNGETIDDELKSQIFVPFFSTKETGAGIGLFLCRQIITLHQGTLSVLTNENRETEFRIELAGK